MPVIASTVTAIESAPAGAESLWDLSRLFIANWPDGMEVTNTWPGSVGTASTSAEKRVCPSGKPGRTVRWTAKATNRDEAWLLSNFLARMGMCRSLVPLYPDHTELGSASAGAVLTCDTKLRRLFVGAPVAIAAPINGAVAFQQFETGIIASLTDTAITLTASPSVVYPRGSRVVPLLECEVMPESKASNAGGGRLTIQLLASEIPGQSALPPLASLGDTISFGSYAGYPVFDPGLNSNIEWLTSESGWKRDNNVTQIGLGNVYQLLGPRPRAHSVRDVKAFMRADGWNLLKIWDYCRGPTFPFFSLPSFQLLAPRAITTTTVQVKAVGPLADWQNYGYLAVVKRQTDSGAARIRPIASVTRASGIDTITLSDPLDSMTLAQVQYVVPAALTRFEAQDLTEQWTTSRNLRLNFNFLELLNEKSVVIANLGETPDAPLTLTATAGIGEISLSWSSSVGADSYILKRSTTMGGPYTVVFTPTGTTQVDTGVVTGTTYYYVVEAVSGGIDSPNSNEASATPFAPDAPLSLTATAGIGQISLAWTAVVGATSYILKRSTTHLGPYSTVFTPSTNSQVDTGVTPGTTYYYVVEAVVSGVHSADSNEASATPMADDPCVAIDVGAGSPSTVHVTVTSSDSGDADLVSNSPLASSVTTSLSFNPEYIASTASTGLADIFQYFSNPTLYCPLTYRLIVTGAGPGTINGTHTITYNTPGASAAGIPNTWSQDDGGPYAHGDQFYSTQFQHAGGEWFVTVWNPSDASNANWSIFWDPNTRCPPTTNPDIGAGAWTLGDNSAGGTPTIAVEAIPITQIILTCLGSGAWHYAESFDGGVTLINGLDLSGGSANSPVGAAGSDGTRTVTVSA